MRGRIVRGRDMRRASGARRQHLWTARVPLRYAQRVSYAAEPRQPTTHQEMRVGVYQPVTALGLPQSTEADRQRVSLRDIRPQYPIQWVDWDFHNFPSTEWATDWVVAVICAATVQHAATTQPALYDVEQTATVLNGVLATK